MAAINLDIGGNTRRLDRDIQKTVNRVYNINLKTKGDQPLGRITGQVNEFNKSLDASNARVIAFGASAGIIFGVQRAFSALVGATIEVQKSLQDVNVILNVSAQNLQKFGGELFNIAKNTGQSFQEVAKAATEFSRQGLGVEETLKRTNEALILSRLSGLDAAKSVEALTAAVNSYASQAVTATEVVNKFANVDAAFAVSSADLAEALARVGSSAAQSGVSLNELIAIVTSAQQTTARGGAVIGNSFKTIFTRLQRGKVVDLLGTLGISDTNASGELKSTIQLLQDLGAVYDTLGARQQAAVAEQVGGVFQINILKAALADLGKEYSIYSSALDVAAGTTDQAIRRNEELNKTYAAQLNALQENARQIASAAGERLIGPSIDRLVGGSNTLLGGINESDGQGVGAVLGKGILDGLGQFIAGPGIALIGGVLLKLFRDLGKFATGSFQQLLGLNTAATQQKDLQASITQILAKNPQLLELALKGEQGLNTAASSLLANLQKQTLELQKQAAVAQQISKAFIAQAGVRVAGGVPVVPTPKPGKVGKAAGYIPNFASSKDKVAETIGAYQANYEPGRIFTKRLFDGQGGSFLATVNSAESFDTVVGPNGNKGTFVTPPNGFAAKGFIPNFAKTKLPENISLDEAIKRNIYSRSQLSQRFGAATVNEKLGSAKKAPKDNIFASRLIGTRLPAILTPSGGGRVASKTQKGVGPNGENVVWNFPVRNANRGPLKQSIESTFGSGNFIDDWINKNLIGISREIATSMGVKPAKPGKLSEIKNAKGFKGAISSTLGTIFDSAITTSLDIATQKDGGDFDIRGGENVRKPIAKLFGENALSKGKSGQWLGDIKISSGPDAVDSMISKTRKEWGNIFTGAPKKKLAFSGYIPNFAAIQSPLQNAINNEIAAGASSNQIRIDKNSKLKTSLNPDGLGVWSKKYEGSLPEGIRMAEKAGINPKTKGMPKAGGYIPNFAIEDPDVQASNTASAFGALATQASALAFAFQFTKEDYKNALKDFEGQTGKAAKGLTKFGIGLQSNALALSIAAPILGETLKNVFGQETKGARVGGAVAGAAGQVGSFAATGALIAGPGPQALVGAGIGAALGGLLTYSSIIEELNSNFPELNKAAQKASQELTKFTDAGQRLLTSSSELARLVSEGSSEKSIAKAEETYAKALGDLSIVDQQRLISAQQVGKLQEEYAKILEEKIVAERESQQTAAVGQVTGAARAQEFSIGNILSSAPRLIGQALLGSRMVVSEENNPVAQYGRGIADYYSPESPFKFGTSEEKLLRESFTSRLTKGRKDQSGLEALNAPENVKKLRGLGREATGEDLKNVLSGILENTSDNLKFIEEITTIPENQDANQFINDVIDSLTSGLLEGDQTIKTTIENIKKATAFEKARGEALKQEQAAINATVSSIQKNIAIQNLWRSAIENINESIRSFSDDLQITQALTQPKEVLGSLIGEDKTPTRRLAAQEGIARIDQTTRSGLAASGIEFKETLRGITQTPFQENIDKIVKKLGEQGGALEGEPEDIIKQSGQFQSEAKAEAQKLLQTTEKMESYMAQFVSGQISTQQLLEQSRTELAGVGIDVSRGSQASDAIEKAVAELEVKTVQEEVKAFQQRAKLASETKQAILQDKINQALGTFGGFEGFMNRPEEQENYIQRINPDLEKIEEMRGSTTFRYNNKESKDEQKKQAPELGRAFANVYKQLIGQSGGAFRNVIQKSIDQARQQTGVESRSGKAGASALGGFDDIVQGRATDLEQQLQLAKDQLKVTTDPVLKRDLEGFISEIENLGIDRIAKLQTMQEFGVARQSDFQEIYGEFENQSLERLKEISPELAASLSDAVTFGDPLLAEAQVQSGVQTQILQTIQKAISGQADGTTGTVEPFDIEAYNKEKDPAKRAAMKAGYGGITPVDVAPTTKKEIDKKVVTTQQKALPKDNRTIAEIEAETKAKRDQKYLTSPLTPLNRTTGKKFESIQQVDAEMIKALALGAMNPEQKEYYNVLKNFKRNLDPTGGADGRKAMFMYDDANPEITRPRIKDESTSNLPKIGDKPTNNLPSLPVSSERMIPWSSITQEIINSIKPSVSGNFPGIPSAPMNFPGVPSRGPMNFPGIPSRGPMNFPGVPSAPGNFPGVPSGGPMNFPSQKTISEIEAETRAKRDQKYLTSPLAPLNRTTGKKFSNIEEVYSELNKSLALGAVNPEQKEYYNVLKNFKQNLNPVGGSSGRQAMFMYDDMNPQVTQPRISQALEANQQPAAAVQQSFTQQEAAFSNNTSALTTLAGGIESLNSTLANFESNFANLNNVPGTQAAAGAQQAGAQPNVTTTTNAPVNVVVNAEGGGDIAAAVGQAVQNAIPTIIDKVKIALGEKIPPSNNRS